MRRVERRTELERLGESLNDELDMFMETGATDKSMCNGVRNTMEKIRFKWEEVSKDFKSVLATKVEGDNKKAMLESLEGYRRAYKEATKKAGETTANLFNTMETERLDREARRGGPAQGGGGESARHAPPQVDKSLRPQYKASYALSLNEFKRWQEMADAWGLASVHKQRPPLVQKMYFEQITEKEFF